MKQTIFIILAFQVNLIFGQNIIVQPGLNNINCNELQDHIDQHGTVCIIKDFSTTFNERFVLNIFEVGCSEVTISDGQHLNIPADMDIKLREEASFLLTGSGSISGTHFASSSIGVSPNGNPNTAINMEDCNGCEISNLTIKSNFPSDTGGETTGLSISGDQDDNAIVNMVKFENLDFGLIVNGDNNEFNDLEFRNVGTKDDCTADRDDICAIELTGNSNTFNNITHTGSEGSITLKMVDECNLNEIYNITLEQDGDACSSGEPSVCIFTTLDLDQNLLFTNNLISTNLNNGRVVIGIDNSTLDAQGNQDLICGSNLITQLNNCNGLDPAMIDCSN